MKRVSTSLTYLVIVVLAMVSALSHQLLIFPNHFAPSGINGLCTMIQHVFGISVGYLSLLINIPLAVWVWLKVGHDMAKRSMVYIAAFSLSLIALKGMDLTAFMYETANGTSKILGPLAAAVINGSIYSMLIQCSASSGGTDFMAALIQRKRPELRFFWITFGLNVVVAFISYFVYDFQIEPVLLCILYCFLSSTVSDKVMRGRRSAVRCEIITDDPERISAAIIERLNRTATLIPAKGMFQGRETSVLLCIVNKSQLPVLSDIISAQPGSFAVLSGASEIIGNFKNYDAHGQLKKGLLDKGSTNIA